MLSGPSGKITQFLLFLCCCGILAFKYYWDRGGRTVMEFLLDSSKQIIASGWIHLLNLGFAMKLEAHYRADGDQCDWYWLNIVLDCTIGVALNYALLQLLTSIASSFAPDQADDLRTGEYRDKNDAFVPATYLKQLTVWMVVVSIMKVCMLLIMVFGHTFLLQLAQLMLIPFDASAEAKLFVVMIATPLLMTAFQFWLTDAFISKKQTAPGLIAGAPEEDDFEHDGHGGRTKIDHGDM